MKHIELTGRAMAMDPIVTSGCALLGVLFATMAGLVRAEVRYRRQALRRPAYQSYARHYGHASERWRDHHHRAAHAGRRRAHAGHVGHDQHAPSTPPSHPVADANPWAPFVVQPTTGCDDLKRQYRALARLHHPDHGGDPDVMAHINELYARLVLSRQSSVVSYRGRDVGS